MLNEIDINEGSLYLGKKAGKEIFEKINKAKKSIKIITPYISSEYVDLLKKKKRQGLIVKLIVSSDIGGDKDKNTSLKKLISQKQNTNEKLKNKRDTALRVIKYSLLFAILLTGTGIFYSVQKIQYAALVFVALYLARKYFSSLVIYSYTYYSELSLSIPMSPYTYGFDDEHTLTHTKLFIIDDESAYVGSINFTKSAFWKNYESRVKLTSSKVIDTLNKEFSYVFKNNSTQYLDINIKGSYLYAEPPN